MISTIRIYFFTKIEAIQLDSTPERKIVNACERGSFYAVMFDNGEYVQFAIQHIFKITTVLEPKPRKQSPDDTPAAGKDTPFDMGSAGL